MIINRPAHLIGWNILLDMRTCLGFELVLKETKFHNTILTTFTRDVNVKSVLRMRQLVCYPIVHKRAKRNKHIKKRSGPRANHIEQTGIVNVNDSS